MGRSPPSFFSSAPRALFYKHYCLSLAAWPTAVYGEIREGGELLGPSFGRAPLSTLGLQHYCLSWYQVFLDDKWCAYEHISSYPPPVAVRGAGLSRLPPAFEDYLRPFLPPPCSFFLPFFSGLMEAKGRDARVSARRRRSAAGKRFPRLWCVTA